MVYRKHTSKSRKYKKSESANDNKAHSHQHSHIEEPDLPFIEPAIPKEKKNPQVFSFLTSIFGSRDKTERTGDPLFTILDHDIYLDDLLLVGLILLLLTDTIDDEILLIILVYLLLDIF